MRESGCETTLTAEQLEAVRFLDVDVETLIADTNEELMTAELSSRREFFDTIETSSLTDEQARAVVCFDNRVQVIAAAGSGKTSVMVARAAYAVDRGFVRPERILLLAFNKAAADELQERVAARFEAAGIDSSGVRASTFHSFGLDVIGRATGEKPRLASWLDAGEDIRMVLRIVDELRDRSETFRYHWDTYRTLFADAPIDLTEGNPDGYDRATKKTGYRTFAGEIVKSHGERLIANFLYLNGVRYVYERPYDVNVADASHSQYHPDFYYPDIDVWHEHWALDRDGKPPAAFEGYAEGMEWKRRLHAQHGTTLVESTWADVIFGDGLGTLQNELTELGLTFDWNPDRPINDEWAKPMKHEDLARLVRTFMTHVKSNSWTGGDLEQRLASGSGTAQRVPDPAVSRPATGRYTPVGPTARHGPQRRLRGHARPGRRPSRSGRGRLPLRLDHGRRIPGRQPGPCPARPWPRAHAGSVSTGGRRRLAVDQPIRRSGPLGDDRLRVLVRPWPAARADDDLSLHADDLRCRQQLRVEEPDPVQETDAVRTRKRRSAHQRDPRRGRGACLGRLPERPVGVRRRRSRRRRRGRHGQR